MVTVIVVHGGAGDWSTKRDLLPEAETACRQAAAAGQALLRQGATALDAVEEAVRLLESAPSVDAGRGSYLNAAGAIEMDALIMDGRNLDLGAVAAVGGVLHPVSLARRVLDSSSHALLAGPGAEAFADSIGFPRCTAADLVTDQQLALHLQTREEAARGVSRLDSDWRHGGDTVGAVALDADGNLAAATSTGGTRAKLPGRVGDSPLAGSGGYADNWTAAVSGTGHGEDLMKLVISKRVCDYVGAGMSAQLACETAVRLLSERLSGQGGLIAVDRRGRIGVAFNTAAMPHAFAVDDEPVAGGR